MIVDGTVTVDGPLVYFTPSSPLPPNCEVEVIVRGAQSADGRLSLEEEVSFRFLTELSPFYTTPDQVRSVAGEFLDDLEDDEIAVRILESSQLADQIAYRPYGTQNDWFPGLTQSQTTNAIYYHEFVLYDAAINLILERTAGHMRRRSEQTQIGPLNIRSQGSMAPEISIVITRLEQKRRWAERMLRLGEGTYPTVAQYTPPIPQSVASARPRSIFRTLS